MLSFAFLVLLGMLLYLEPKVRLCLKLRRAQRKVRQEYARWDPPQDSNCRCKLEQRREDEIAWAKLARNLPPVHIHSGVFGKRRCTEPTRQCRGKPSQIFHTLEAQIHCFRPGGIQEALHIVVNHTKKCTENTNVCESPAVQHIQEATR